MPKPRQRTRSQKRILRTLPGGSRKTHYKGQAGVLLHCRLCGQVLGGKSGLSAVEAGKLNRSKRRVWRPYGGEVCHGCLKESLKQVARRA